MTKSELKALPLFSVVTPFKPAIASEHEIQLTDKYYFHLGYTYYGTMFLMGLETGNITYIPRNKINVVHLAFLEKDEKMFVEKQPVILLKLKDLDYGKSENPAVSTSRAFRVFLRGFDTKVPGQTGKNYMKGTYVKKLNSSLSKYSTEKGTLIAETSSLVTEELLNALSSHLQSIFGDWKNVDFKTPLKHHINSNMTKNEFDPYEEFDITVNRKIVTVKDDNGEHLASFPDKKENNRKILVENNRKILVEIFKHFY